MRPAKADFREATGYRIDPSDNQMKGAVQLPGCDRTAERV